jgi:hypothetical protein
MENERRRLMVRSSRAQEKILRAKSRLTTRLQNYLISCLPSHIRWETIPP